ncbi:MAG: hypothetical protein ACYDBJ_09945 [Aggregatilineales bacterium]
MEKATTDNPPQSDRHVYWRMLGHEYAHIVGPVTTGADVAFDYALEHDWQCAERPG